MFFSVFLFLFWNKILLTKQTTDLIAYTVILRELYVYGARVLDKTFCLSMQQKTQQRSDVALVQVSDGHCNKCVS